ncbi:CLUMA_CG017114, isoform A, partial [Clunio marinus]
MILIKFMVGSFAMYCGVLIYSNAQNIISQALFLGNPSAFNTTRDDCKWKYGNERDICPDPDINVILYTSVNGGKNRGKLWLDVGETDWLRMSAWNGSKENIILVHGYAGGDDLLPMAVARDAYLNHGEYNVFVVDWSPLCQPPCYIAAVHNMKTVAHCVAKSFTFLRNAGLRPDKTTCVGHSLGAHICGLMANHLNFRLERIIALDPARPLIRPGNNNRLDNGDARSVQVIHTNAGYYGEGGRIGHIDFCVNGGRRQPYCSNTTNVNLCSHIWAICYLAQSVFDSSEMIAEPCLRKCPSGVNLVPNTSKPGRIPKSRYGFALNYGIPMGHSTPKSASGSFCFKGSDPPFCPKHANDIGDKRCCLEAPDLKETHVEVVVKVVKREEKSTMSLLVKNKIIFVSLLVIFKFIKEIFTKEFELGPCYLSFLEPCANNSIQFFLYSNDTPLNQPILLDNLSPNLELDYNATIKKNFKMIIHGYGGHLDANGFKQIRNAYLRNPETMVIVVDWSRLARLPCYPSAALNTKQAGECTAQFLLGMEENNEGFKASNVHAIGFSLGAHVASFASNAIEKSLGVKFNRITGLDPALPFFATARQHWKLDSTDGNFVDVIHTNSGVYGKLEACGHIDFFMNNGQFQPACVKAKSMELQAEYENLCSHMMAL